MGVLFLMRTESEARFLSPHVAVCQLEFVPEDGVWRQHSCLWVGRVLSSLPPPGQGPPRYRSLLRADLRWWWELRPAHMSAHTHRHTRRSKWRYWRLYDTSTSSITSTAEHKALLLQRQVKLRFIYPAALQWECLNEREEIRRLLKLYVEEVGKKKVKSKAISSWKG